MKVKKNIAKEKRIRRIRSKVVGTALQPRLAVFRSLRHIYAALIDDQKSITLVAASDFDFKKVKDVKRVELAFKIGEKLADKAASKKIKKIIFDKRGYGYHGLIKSLAEGARKGGLDF